MKEIILQTIKENKLIKKGDKIILGISGGPDSVCLLYILNSLKKELNFKLVLAHINYNFRGKDSIADEEFVRNLAKKLKVKLYAKNIKPSDYEKKNLEEYFREIRYGYFNKILKLEKADRIIVAHNKDDQVETVLMHFLRGSGLSGLSGMKTKNNKIIRPLLNIEKSDILAYLKKNSIKYREDKTNKDIKFTRNKVSHQLIPYLEKNYNPSLKNTLYNNAEIIRDDQDLLLDFTRDIFNKIVQKKEREYRISLKKFNSFHIALKRRLLMYIVSEKLNQEISLLMINEILKLLNKSRSGSKKIIKEIEIIKNYDKIVIRKRKKQIKIEKLSLKMIGETDISSLGVKLKTRKVDRCSQISKNKCYIDQDNIRGGLFVRTRKEGDKFYPFGMNGSQKLKEYFINHKVEQDKRDQILLIVNNKNEIVWIVGFRMDRRFKPNKSSKNILEIQITK